MLRLTKTRWLGIAVAIGIAGLAGIALAQDKETVLKNRQATMKEQGKDLGAVKAYLRSEEHTSELQSHSDLPSFPTRRSSDLVLAQIRPDQTGEVRCCG